MVERKESIDKDDQDDNDSMDSGKGISKPLIWIGLVLLFLVFSGGAYLLAKNYVMPKYQLYKSEKKAEEEEKMRTYKPDIGLLYVIKDLTVNTMGAGGCRFAVVEYALEATDKTVIEEVKSRESQLRDEYIKYLRRHTAEQILELSFQETSRSELIQITNNQLNSGRIDSLYYIKLIVQ